MVHIGNEWDQLLADEFKKDYYQKLRRFLAYEYAHQRVYPDMYDIFNALKYTPYHQVKASWDRILTMARDRHTGCASPCSAA